MTARPKIATGSGRPTWRRNRALTLIKPLDEPLVIAGQGTTGLEIAEQAAERGVERGDVLVCCGGGGLTSGIALALEARAPYLRARPVEPAGFDDVARSLAAGTILSNARTSGSICDAIVTPRPGTLTFPVMQRLCGPGLVVTDDEALRAMALAFSRFASCWSRGAQWRWPRRCSVRTDRGRGGDRGGVGRQRGCRAVSPCAGALRALMPHLLLPELRLHVTDDGPRTARAIVFAHALGTDLRVWDHVVAALRPGRRMIRLDMRGHGLSDVPPSPYPMGALVRDAERALDALGVRDAIVVGLSIGGLIAQGLATKRPGPRGRAGAVEYGGQDWRSLGLGGPDCGGARGRDGAISEATLARWFPRPFRDGSEAALWRSRLEATPVDGWIGAAAAIAGADFYTTTAALTLPTLVIAGSEDGSTPPDVVRETAELIAGARFSLLRRTGHLPRVDRPDAFVAVMETFLDEIGAFPPGDG